MWKIVVWDGDSRREYTRSGTYDQVTAHCRQLPQGYIWHAEPV